MKKFIPILIFVVVVSAVALMLYPKFENQVFQLQNNGQMNLPDDITGSEGQIEYGLQIDDEKSPDEIEKPSAPQDGQMNLPDDITGSEGQIEYGLYCENDSDCVVQPINCNNCGCPTAVNKDFYKELDCSDSTSEANCNAWCPVDKIKVRCLNNSCVAELAL